MMADRPDNDPMGVTISTRDIYDQVVGIRDDVRTLTHSGVATNKMLEDHEQRLRGIERWRYSVPTAAVAAVASAAVTLVKTLGG